MLEPIGLVAGLLIMPFSPGSSRPVVPLCGRRVLAALDSALGGFRARLGSSNSGVFLSGTIGTRLSRCSSPGWARSWTAPLPGRRAGVRHLDVPKLCGNWRELLTSSKEAKNKSRYS